MTKTLKTAPELERYILNALRSCAACNGVSAVTVSAGEGSDWEISHISAAGDVVPQTCRDICDAVVERLRESYDLVTEIEPED